MQPLLRDWGARNRAAGLGEAAIHDGRMLDQYRIDWFHEMNRALDDRLDDAALVARLIGNVARMDWLSREILARVRVAYPDVDDHGLAALHAGDAWQHPSLPAQWYAGASEAEAALA
jgi:hypothetical protein